MAWWVYKCNSRQPWHAGYSGDWDDFFEWGEVTEWGSTERVKALQQLALHDMCIAFQSNRNELVGVTEVVRLRKRKGHLDIYQRPVETIGVKVRPLKKADPKIAAIPALQPGPIKTIYEISAHDAQRLLRAARAASRRINKT